MSKNLNILLIMACLFVASCNGKSKPDEDADADGEIDAEADCEGDVVADADGPPDTVEDMEGEETGYVWTNVGPEGGFISSVAFHPLVEGEVWVSGDDASGLFRSIDDGNSWTLLTSPPPDQSTYSLRFDPLEPTRVYAPNHFGRGFLRSFDGGDTWSFGGNGLPVSGTPRRVYDLAVHPVNIETLFICLEGGLFKSVDYGDTFTQVTSPTFGGDVDFRSVAIDSPVCSPGRPRAAFTSAWIPELPGLKSQTPNFCR